MSEAGLATRVASSVPFYATGKRSRDLAQEMGITEAEVLAAHAGPEVVRLKIFPADLLLALPNLGEVMCLTRNEAAVHEKVGSFGATTISRHTALVLNGAIDLRLFLQHWQAIFAVEIPDEKGPKRSLQVFDASGDAVVKIHLKPASDIAAFEALRDQLGDPCPAKLAIMPCVPDSEQARDDMDAGAFQAAYTSMRDIHEFFPLLKRFGLSRRRALDHMVDDHVRPLAPGAARRLLEQASADRLPIMCFVGNRGCIQIHRGPVTTIKVLGPWLNVLDPGFNLHLREDLVTETWLVRKPTRHGLISSVELYGADRELIAQFFGVRDEQSPEDPAWRALASSLREGCGS